MGSTKVKPRATCLYSNSELPGALRVKVIALNVLKFWMGVVSVLASADQAWTQQFLSCHRFIIFFLC